MKIVYNNVIPFPGFKAINLFGILFVRKGETMSDIDINHELIHTAQMKEMLYIFFYLWYLIEWLLRLINISLNKLFITNDLYWDDAYRYLSFENEAYSNQSDLKYLEKRKFYNWIHYFIKK